MNIIGYITQADLEKLQSEGGEESIALTKAATGDSTIALVAQDEANEAVAQRNGAIADRDVAIQQLLTATSDMLGKTKIPDAESTPDESEKE